MRGRGAELQGCGVTMMIRASHSRNDEVVPLRRRRRCATKKGALRYEEGGRCATKKEGAALRRRRALRCEEGGADAKRERPDARKRGGASGVRSDDDDSCLAQPERRSRSATKKKALRYEEERARPASRGTYCGSLMNWPTSQTMARATTMAASVANWQSGGSGSGITGEAFSGVRGGFQIPLGTSGMTR
jgi:hypothetical protein